MRCDVIKVNEGGEIRHVFFDTGQGQLLAFMEPRGVPRDEPVRDASPVADFRDT